MTIPEMQKARAAAVANAKAIIDECKAKSVDLTAEQATQVDSFLAEKDDWDAKIQAAEQNAARIARVDGAAASIGNGGRSTAAGASSVRVTKENFEDDPKCGFKSHREFLSEVMNVSIGRTQPSKRLQFLRSPDPQSAAGSDEQSIMSNPYGGFLLPEGFAPNLLTVPMEGDPTAGLVTPVPMQVPTINLPARVDKNHSTSVSGGLRVYRRAETAAANSSRTELERIKLEATSLTGLAYASEELLTYSPISFVALLDAGFGDEFRSKMLKEKLNGTGVGEAMGVINAPGTVSIAKETMQTADTINGTNITKMRARCYNYSRAIWLANHDTLPNLMACHIALTNGSVALFAPGNGTDKPDTLFGRPIYFTEYCKTIGDLGDIILGDWSQYLWGTLGNANPNRAESIHVRFEYNERAFRFTMMNDGQPWWRSALTPANGSNTLSPFVTLAERA